MNRRELLAGVGGALVTVVSGCIGDNSPPANTQDIESDSNATDESKIMNLSLTEVDDNPEGLSLDIELRQNQLTTTDVPKLDITAENREEESITWSYGGGKGNLPLRQGIRDAVDGVLIIGLEDEIESQLMDTSHGCARVEQFTGSDAVKETHLEPGEKIERQYAIAGVDRYLEEKWPKSKTYRMEHDYENRKMWGFEFQLDEISS